MSIFAQICSSLYCYYSLIHLQSVSLKTGMITLQYFLSSSLLALTKTHANQIKWKSISDKTSENSQWMHATYSHHISLYFLRQFYKYQPIYFSLSPMSLKVNRTLNIVPYACLWWPPHCHRKESNLNHYSQPTHHMLRSMLFLPSAWVLFFPLGLTAEMGWFAN